MLQLLFQIPVSEIHKNEKSVKNWQSIIGFYSIWDLNKEGLPKTINVSNVVYKCFMYAFIILQQQIFSSQEYKDFTYYTIRNFQDLSKIKGDSIAYLYNNFKIQTTIKNQIEKNNMIKKLNKVDKQVKKWNKTVFSKTQVKKKSGNEAMFKKTEVVSLQIAEVAEEEEDEKEKSAFDEELEPLISLNNSNKGQDKNKSMVKDSTDDENKEEKHYLVDYQDIDRKNLIKKLVEEKLNILWKVQILGSRYLTNQILVMVSSDKLKAILHEVKEGETKIYTNIELLLLKDFERNKEIMIENDYKAFEEIPDEQKIDDVAKETKSYKMIIAYVVLFFHILLSNTALICYLFMIIAHIMNGSLVSMVYPVSIFIYALLEERRPRKIYWRFIIFYSAIILFIKFLLQTYPISFYFTDGNVENDGSNNDQISTALSFNDFLRTTRLGLEVIVDGKNFVNYFLFEALILLSVIFHMFIQIIGGVWDQREIEKESIHEAAVRISNIQKVKAQEAKGEQIIEWPRHMNGDRLKVDPENDIILIDHYQRTRKRSHSMNDVLNLREIRQDKNNRGESTWYHEYPIEMDEWSDYEDNFTYGG